MNKTMTNPLNEENIAALKDVIQTNRSGIAVFVGAGASVPLGISGWNELLKAFAKTHNIDIDVDKSIVDKGFPGTASEICGRLGDYDKYTTFMAEQFEPRNCRYTSLHEILLEQFKVILTTNYDAAFEKCCQKKGLRINPQKLPNFNVFTLFQDLTIVYLHGNNEERKYIFTREEYDSYYPSISGIEGSHELESFLREVVKKINLIFIGFSFKDPYIYSFIAGVMNEIVKEEEIHQRTFKQDHPQNNIQHFVILADDKKDAIEEITKLKRLRVITYRKGYHADIETIIESVFPPTVGSIEEEGNHAK